MIFIVFFYIAQPQIRLIPATYFSTVISSRGESDRYQYGDTMNYDLEAARLKKDWAENPRWKGTRRAYAAEDVVRLRGSVHIEHTLARRGAEKLWKLVQ